MGVKHLKTLPFWFFVDHFFSESFVWQSSRKLLRGDFEISDLILLNKFEI